MQISRLAPALLAAALGLTLSACAHRDAEEPPPPLHQWIQLFNGKDLAGWTPKIRHQPFGEDPRRTFRVEDGVIKVVYDEYEAFDETFGHLFFRTPFSHYRLRVEYRFVGEQLQGGPGWAVRNSGIMLHCQDPRTMTLDQDFPVSLEAQLLGGDGTQPRTTANLCTPGTHVTMDGRLVTRHCIGSTSKTYHGDQWVTVEVEARGNEVIRHIMEDEMVIQYEKPILDTNDPSAKRLVTGDTLDITGGYISLQSESHPVQFRKVEIMLLDEGSPQTSERSGP